MSKPDDDRYDKLMKMKREMLEMMVREQQEARKRHEQSIKKEKEEKRKRKLEESEKKELEREDERTKGNTDKKKYVPIIEKMPMQIISKYFDGIKDFARVEMVSKRYRGLMETFRFNPIPITTEKELELFRFIETYHVYEEEGKKYQWKYGNEVNESNEYIESEFSRFDQYKDRGYWNERYTEILENRYFDDHSIKDVKRRRQRTQYEWHEKLKMMNRGLNKKYKLEPKEKPMRRHDYEDKELNSENSYLDDVLDPEERPVDVDELIDMYNDMKADKTKIVYHFPVDKKQYNSIKEELGDNFELKKGGNMTSLDDLRKNLYTEVHGVIDTAEIAPDQQGIKADLHEYDFLVKGSMWFAQPLRDVFKMKEKVYEVILPPAIVELGFSMFAACKIESIDIPESVTELGDYCFMSCFDLKEFKGCSVKKVGKRCFDHCTTIKKIILSDKIEELPEACFEGCFNLRELYFSNTNNVIGGDIVIPNSVKKIGRRCFGDCWKITEITIPESVIELDTCFIGCESLMNVYNNGSIRYIGGWCFAGCRYLKLVGLHKKDDYDLTIDLPLDKIGPFSFSSVKAESMYIPDSVKIIELGAFDGCDELTKIYMPKELLFVEKDVFQHCDCLRKIEFKKNLLLLESFNFIKYCIDIYVPKKAFLGLLHIKRNVKIIQYDDDTEIDNEDIERILAEMSDDEKN